MKIYTIGFTKKSARTFFGLLQESGAERLIDVRLNNISQLAGFAKRDDLAYFLADICRMGYYHELLLAPTQDLLDEYKKREGLWDEYEQQFLALMAEREIEKAVSPTLIGNSVLLCSEAAAHHCHRRLVAEYLAERWDDVVVEHLG